MSNKSTRLSLAAMALLFATVMFACGGGTDGDGDGDSGTQQPPDNGGGIATNTVSYDGKTYPLSAGLEEVFRPDDNHANSQLNVTNGEFYSVQVPITGNLSLIWRARNASIWFYADVYSPGTGQLQGGTFSYVPRGTDEDDPALAQTFFFKDGKFAVDLNGDGSVKSDDGEFLTVTGGTITLEPSGAIYKVDFQFELENGQTARGSFTGDFAQV
ncbi:MAG: hypothetical protein AB8C46_13225 [Burkholderiaceae bacterium]